MGAKDVAFLKLWPKHFIAFMATVELFAAIVILLTELGNVGANFWLTNVFAGGWCGVILLVKVITLYVATICKPGLISAYRAAVIAVVALFACSALIGFDTVFMAQPTTCVLTPSCTENAASNTTSTYSFRKSFFDVFNTIPMFRLYGESDAKRLFHAIQVGVGALCFLLCILYLVVYYVMKDKVTKNAVTPAAHSKPKSKPGQNTSQSTFTPPQQPTQPYTIPQPDIYATLHQPPPGFAGPQQNFYPPPQQLPPGYGVPQQNYYPILQQPLPGYGVPQQNFYPQPVPTFAAPQQNPYSTLPQAVPTFAPPQQSPYSTLPQAVPTFAPPQQSPYSTLPQAVPTFAAPQEDYYSTLPQAVPTFAAPQQNPYPSLHQSHPQNLNEPQQNPVPPPPPPIPASRASQPYSKPTVPAWRPPPYVPQAAPGIIPWNAGKRS